jgi:hypothetical protein
VVRNNTESSGHGTSEQLRGTDIARLAGRAGRIEHQRRVGRKCLVESLTERRALRRLLREGERQSRHAAVVGIEMHRPRLVNPNPDVRFDASHPR